MDWNFETVAGPFDAVAEGPAWDGRYVYFTLIQQNRVMRYDPATGECIEWHSNSHRSNGLLFDAQGRLYGCSVTKQAILRLDADGTSTVIADRLEGSPINTPNDLAIDRKGRIWFTCPWNTKMQQPGQRRGLEDEPVLRADPLPGGSWSVVRAASDTSNPNGILISADERTLYVSQCDYGFDMPRELRAYPIREDGSLGPFIVLHTFGQDYRGTHRAIDGMCLDAEGNIVATAGQLESGPGPLIYVFSPAGRILETHPCERPTNCTFGDADLRSLYVTTGSMKGPGKLLRARTNRKGWNLYP